MIRCHVCRHLETDEVVGHMIASTCRCVSGAMRSRHTASMLDIDAHSKHDDACMLDIDVMCCWHSELRVMRSWGRLRYNKAAWVAIERLEQHWVRAAVDARIVDPPGGVTLGQPPSASTVLEVETANVAALTITPEQIDLKTVPVVVRRTTLACKPLGERSL